MCLYNGYTTLSYVYPTFKTVCIYRREQKKTKSQWAHQPENQFIFTLCSISLSMIKPRYSHIIKMFQLKRIRCGHQTQVNTPLIIISVFRSIAAHFWFSFNACADCAHASCWLLAQRYNFSLLVFVVAVESCVYQNVCVLFEFLLNGTPEKRPMKYSVTDEPSSSSFLLSLRS